MLTSDLMTNANTTIELSICYAIYFKRKIVVTKHETYIQIIPKIPLITDRHDTNYGYALYTEDVTNIESENSKFSTLAKLLKSISSYKVTDLRDLAEVQLNHVSNGK